MPDFEKQKQSIITIPDEDREYLIRLVSVMHQRLDIAEQNLKAVFEKVLEGNLDEEKIEVITNELTLLCLGRLLEKGSLDTESLDKDEEVSEYMEKCKEVFEENDKTVDEVMNIVVSRLKDIVSKAHDRGFSDYSAEIEDGNLSEDSIMVSVLSEKVLDYFSDLSERLTWAMAKEEENLNSIVSLPEFDVLKKDEYKLAFKWFDYCAYLISKPTDDSERRPIINVEVLTKLADGEDSRIYDPKILTYVAQQVLAALNRIIKEQQ